MKELKIKKMKGDSAIRVKCMDFARSGTAIGVFNYFIINSLIINFV